VTRRTIALIAAIIALVSAVLLAALPANASRSHAVDPTTINPVQLKLPDSVLPAGTGIDHSAVSDNPDADAITTPPDKFLPTPYLAPDRVRERDAWPGRPGTHHRVSDGLPLHDLGAAAGTEYLASIFPSAAKAQAAMNDAIGPGSLIAIIGSPLAHQCTVGDVCKAYSGPVPGSTNQAVVAIFTDGPILVETATQVPADRFDALEPTIESTLFSLLAAADIQVKAVLNGKGGDTDTPTPTLTATNTPAPTATATSTDTPVPPTATPTKQPVVLHCKKGYTIVSGKCKKTPHCKKGYKVVKGKCKKLPVCKKGYTLVHGKCKKHK
jgi:hypothetical protein